MRSCSERRLCRLPRDRSSAQIYLTAAAPEMETPPLKSYRPSLLERETPRTRLARRQQIRISGCCCGQAARKWTEETIVKKLEEVTTPRIRGDSPVSCAFVPLLSASAFECRRHAGIFRIRDKIGRTRYFFASVVRNRAIWSESRQFEEGPEEPPKIRRCKRFAPRAKFPLAKGFILC